MLTKESTVSLADEGRFDCLRSRVDALQTIRGLQVSAPPTRWAPADQSSRSAWD
jgi:hypothetical protein